uniref:Uncharacterized protein n=1 Tax=Strigops habroptila TaxID=2489341 RepID=A0A672UIP1_STRHB
MGSKTPLRQGSKGERSSPSSAVAVPLEVEPELEDPVGKLAAEAMPVGILPLAVDNLEGDVLVGRPGVEAQDGKVLVVLTGLQEVLGRRALVDQVGVEDVELVALHDLGRRVVKVVVGLVVLVPLEARVHPVEEAGLTGPVLVSPEVSFACKGHLHAELCLVCTHSLLSLTEEDVIRAPTCDLQLLTQEQQAMSVLLGLQHVGIEGQLVGAQQPGAVLPCIVVIQALLDQVLLHQHSLSLGLCILLSLWLRGRPWLYHLLWIQPARKREERTGTGMVPWFSAHLRSAYGRMGAQGCIFCPECPMGDPQMLPKGRASYLSLGEASSCLMMGKSGSLSTPCSCFNLYSFWRSTSCPCSYLARAM